MYKKKYQNVFLSLGVLNKFPRDNEYRFRSTYFRFFCVQANTSVSLVFSSVWEGLWKLELKHIYPRQKRHTRGWYSQVVLLSLFLLTVYFVCVCVCSIAVPLFGALWTVAHQVPLSMDFSRRKYWSGCRFLLQGPSRPRDWTPASCSGRRILSHQSRLGSPTVFHSATKTHGSNINSK